jgi:hypothetical protein
MIKLVAFCLIAISVMLGFGWYSILPSAAKPEPTWYCYTIIGDSTGMPSPNAGATQRCHPQSEESCETERAAMEASGVKTTPCHKRAA